MLEMVKNIRRRVIQTARYSCRIWGDKVTQQTDKRSVAVYSLCKLHVVRVGGGVGGLSGPLRRLEDDSELKS